MHGPSSYRHRVITDQDLVFIRRLIAANPGSSRHALSKKLCQAWNWVQANGALRDTACRSMSQRLSRLPLASTPASLADLPEHEQLSLPMLLAR